MPKPRHLIGAFAAILLLALPASAAAKPGGKSVDRLATQACAKERKQLGRSAFLKKYGERAPARACLRRARNRAKAALRDASNECLAELAEIGPAEFAEDYGTDETGSDAYEECVELTASASLDPDEGYEEYEDEEEEEE
jgi:transposase